MGKALARILFFLCAAILVAEMIYGFLAYFVTSQASDGAITDGLGRRLVPTPALIRYFFGQDRMWAGWQWFVGEMVVLWGVLLLMNLLSGKAFPKESETK